MSFLVDIDLMNLSCFLVLVFCMFELLFECVLCIWLFWCNEKWEMLFDYCGVCFY